MRFWRASAVVLISALALGQVPSPASSSSSPRDTLDRTAHLRYVEYDQLRRGTEMKFLYIVVQPPGTGQCINVADLPDAGRSPVRIEFDEQPGLTITQPQPASPTNAKCSVGGIPTATATEIKLLISVRAVADLTLGPAHLRGRISFQTIGGDGVPHSQLEPFDVPIQIVERKTKVERTNYFRKLTAGEVLNIAWRLPLFPVCLAYQIATHEDYCF